MYFCSNLNWKERIRTYFCSFSPGIDAGTSVEDGELIITPVSESFACVSLSNPSLSQYAFKSIQQSKFQVIRVLDEHDSQS